MTSRRKSAAAAAPEQKPEIDGELTEMLNAGIRSLEEAGPVSASEFRRILAKDRAACKAESAARKPKK